MADDPVIDWKKDSQSFDTVAELYDAYRPGYPPALVSNILSASAIPMEGRILEIGSGTGKATIQFAGQGCSLLCIEPGDNLVKIARHKLQSFPKVVFRVTTFEDWDAPQEAFDLVISAQAFHWISEEIRYKKTARVLKRGGTLALFWNRYPALDSAVAQAMHQVYQVHAPELMPRTQTTHEDGIRHWTEEIQESGYYDLLEVKRYPWKALYTTEQYIGLLNTYSDHLRLPQERRQILFEEVAKAIERLGGRIERPYETVAFLGKKRNTINPSI